MLSGTLQALPARSDADLASGSGGRKPDTNRRSSSHTPDEDRMPEKLYRAICAALERRLPRSGPVEILLSEGLDSNIIASIAVKEFGREVVGYTWRQPGSSAPSRNYPRLLKGR